MELKLNKLIIPILIATFAVCSEYVPELFRHIPFKYKVPDNAGYEFDTSYRDAVWYFIYGLFIWVLMIIIFYQMPKNNIAGKVIMIAPISWFAIELYEKICFLVKINDNRLYVNDGSKWQIFIMLFLVLSGLYGLRRFKL